MSLAQVISRRVADTGPTDPDTLHGALCLLEGRNDEGRIADLMGITVMRFRNTVERAREGTYPRVLPAHRAKEERAELLEGLFPRQWRRDLIAMMLRPDGVATPEVETIAATAQQFDAPAQVIYELRGELKVNGVRVESRPLPATPFFRYRIVGRDAWRMQKIIANGWAL